MKSEQTKKATFIMVYWYESLARAFRDIYSEGDDIAATEEERIKREMELG